MLANISYIYSWFIVTVAKIPWRAKECRVKQQLQCLHEEPINELGANAEPTLEGMQYLVQFIS
jgi:hypothetical protein